MMGMTSTPPSETRWPYATAIDGDSAKDFKAMSSQWHLEELAKSGRYSLHLKTMDGLNTIPFTVLTGAERTPVALIIAGVHGDEYEGPAAIHTLIEELDPGKIRGSIIFVPVANPVAFAATTRRHPVDHGDLNRSFPGSPHGGPADQLAHLLIGEFALVSNCIFSLHGWSKEASVVPYAEYGEGDTPAISASREAARSLGFPYLHPYHWPAGVLGNTALTHGIPIVEAEIGGMGTITSAGQTLYRSAILRFLAHFQVLQFPTEPQPEPMIVDHSDLVASHAGLFRSSVELADTVVAGQDIGTVHALDGSLLETLRSPRSGVVAILRRLASVQPGDRLAQLFYQREIIS
jgi:predicted deacylase